MPSLDFASTNSLNCGSGASYDSADPLTYLAWLNPDVAHNAGIWAKGTGAGANRRSMELGNSRVSHGFYFIVDRATTDAQFEAPVTEYVVWQGFAAGFDSSAGTGILWRKLLSSAATRPTMTTSDVGSGAPGNNDANNQYFGVFGAGTSGGLDAKASHIAMFRVLLTDAQVTEWFRRPRNQLDGTVAAGFYRTNSTSSLPDLTGHGNTAAVNGGPALSTLAPPLRELEPHRWAGTARAGFRG